MGSAAGVRAMKQSISGEHGKEYRNAIKTWGLKS
jgi:hypothetical protein